MPYRIVTDEEGPYGSTRSVAFTDGRPDDLDVFRTYQEAKRALAEEIEDEIAEQLERLSVLRWNLLDLRRSRKEGADHER